MSTSHFSGDQISQWVAGEKPAHLATHLELCRECRSEVARLEALLAVFHDGLHAAAASTRVPALEPSRLAWELLPRWPVAGAVAALLVAVPLYRNSRLSAPAPAPVVMAEVSDAQLLDQINAQLARHVPGPLEPLEALSYSPLEELSKGKNQ